MKGMLLILLEANEIMLHSFDRRIANLVGRANRGEDVRDSLYELEEEIWDAHNSGMLGTTEHEAADLIVKAFESAGQQYEDDPTKNMSQEEMADLIKIFGTLDDFKEFEEDPRPRHLRLVKDEPEIG